MRAIRRANAGRDVSRFSVAGFGGFTIWERIVTVVSRPLSTVEAKELIRLCETGRLYELDAWIVAGKSLVAPTSEAYKIPRGPEEKPEPLMGQTESR